MTMASEYSEHLYAFLNGQEQTVRTPNVSGNVAPPS